MGVPLHTAQKVVAKSPASSVKPTRTAGGPPVRKDGKCYVCKKKRPPIAVAHEDPFCSGVCCRAWYGCSLAVDLPPSGERQRRL